MSEAVPETIGVGEDKPKDVTKWSHRNLHQKIAAISGELGAIQKDSRAPDVMGGFAFLSHGTLMGHLRDKLSKAGVTIWESLSIVSDEQVTMKTAKGERDARRVVVKLDVIFVNADDPSQAVEVAWHGEGLDSTDKAMQKAATSAEKYLLFKTFKVSDKDDPDGAEVDGVEGVGPTPVATPSTRPPSLPIPPSRGQAAPGPVPSTTTSSPSRGPAAPVPGTPRSSGNMLTLQRPKPPAEAKEEDAPTIGQRTEVLTMAMTAAQQMSPGMTEIQVFEAAEKYLDKLSQSNWGKAYKDLNEKQVSGLVVFFKEKFKPESA